MGGSLARKKGGKKFVPDPEFYAVDPHKEFPQEWYCMNCMCRAKFWRAYGESEFCPACRKCVSARLNTPPKAVRMSK